jgi:transcriptional regulator with XRE-family HTH domain
MPRPSKHVSPDTLGGRIRAAREELHLSLADVANGHYSTSLISQIERNRVDPSQESLRFLAERLNLPFEDLEALAQQHRESEVEARQYRSFEDLRHEITQLLKNKDVAKALSLLQPLHFAQIPTLQRWRIAALRGQCYYEQKQFLQAIQDFIYAINELPKQETLSAEQRHELMLLHLHLAASYRHLGLDEALEQYQITLRMINNETPFGYVAEAHWGMSIIAFVKAYRLKEQPGEHDSCRKQLLQTALEHAENARVLYRSIHDPLQESLVRCHIAQIERELGNTDRVQRDMSQLLEIWADPRHAPLHGHNGTAETSTERQQRANIIAVAACTLCGIALEQGDYTQARTYAMQALEAAEQSNPRRQADAQIVYGRLLEATNEPEQAEVAYRRAVAILDATEHVDARIYAHIYLGSVLIRRGKVEEGQAELTQARKLSEMVALQKVSIENENSTTTTCLPKIS